MGELVERLLFSHDNTDLNSIINSNDNLDDLSSFFGRNFQQLKLSRNGAAHFVTWFILGSILNLPDSGLMGSKLKTPALYVRYDEEFSSIKIAYAQNDPDMRRIKLAFRTILIDSTINEDDHRSMNVGFSAHDLEELAYQWDMDFFDFPKYEVDSNLVSIKLFIQDQKVSNVEIEKQKISNDLINSLYHVCKDKVCKEMLLEEVHLNEEFRVISSATEQKVQEMSTWLSSLGKPSVMTVKKNCDCLLSRLKENFQMTAFANLHSSQHGQMAFITGALFLNYKNRHQLDINLDPTFMMDEDISLILVSKIRSNPRLNINIPIYISATFGPPASRLNYLTNPKSRAMLPSFDTDSSVGILTVVNLLRGTTDFQTTNALATVEINEGFLRKLLEIYDAPFLGDEAGKIMERALNFDIDHLGQPGHDLFETYFHGMMLSIHKNDLHRHDDLELQSYKFHYAPDALDVPEQISTYIISHGTSVIFFHLHNTGPDMDKILQAQFLATSCKVFGLNKWLQFFNFYNVHISTRFEDNRAQIHIDKFSMRDVILHSKAFAGEVVALKHIDILNFLNLAEQRKAFEAHAIMKDALSRSKGLVTSNLHFKMLFKGLIVAKCTFLSKFEHWSTEGHIIVAISQRQIPHLSLEYSLAERLRSPPHVESPVSYKETLFVALQYTKEKNYNTIWRDMTDNFWINYQNRYALSEFRHDPVFVPMLFSDGQAPMFQMDVKSAFKRDYGQAFHTQQGMSEMFKKCRTRTKRAFVCPLWSEIFEENQGKFFVDSDKFNEFLFSHQNTVDADELLDFVSTIDHNLLVPTGRSTESMEKLVVKNRLIRNLRRVGTTASIGTMALMGKNIVSDVVQGKYGGALLTSSILATSPLLSKLSSYMATVGTSGILTTALKMTSPFVGKLTSAFVLYDLIKNIKFLINGNSKDRVVSAANIFADGTLLGIDAAEIGLNLAETFGVVEGLGDIFGPLGAGLGLLVFVGVDIFIATRKVSQIEQKIKLTSNEKFYEGVRAFFGAPPEKYIGHLLEEKEHYQTMFNATVKFLSENPFLRTYIFPAQSLVKGAWSDDQDNVISLAGKPHDQKVGRNKPDLPEDYKLACFNTLLDIEPVGFLESMFSMVAPRKFFTIAKKLATNSDDQPGMTDENFDVNCSQAVGLTNMLSTGDQTMIDIRDGTDIVKGSDHGRNIFRIGNGLKHKVKGGDKNDLFIFDGNETGGLFEGVSGDDTADFRNFALHAKTLEFRSSNGRMIVFYKNSNFEIILHDVENFIGRHNAPDLITTNCETRFIDSNHGGPGTSNDFIHIMDKICFYQLTVVVGHNLLIRNDAKFGNFDYMIEENACGIIFLDRNTLAQHRFIFRSGFDQLILVSKVDIRSRSLVFHFGGETGLVIHSLPFSKCTFHFGDGTELITSWNNNLHMHAYINSYKTWSTVEDFTSYYDNMSKNHNCSMTVHDQIKNFTLMIANPYESSASHVFHNNPYQSTMIIGRGQENVYVINYDLNIAQLPNVTIQDNGTTKKMKTIDMNDFSQILNQSVEVTAIVEYADIVLLIKRGYQVLMSIILKNANETFESYYILYNRATFQITKLNDGEKIVLKSLPMTISQDRDYLILSEDDIPLVNTSIAINKTVQDIMPVKFNSSLILYDMKDGDIAFFVILNNFYTDEIRRLHTVILKFDNRSFAVEKFFKTKPIDLESKIILEKIRKRKIFRNMIDDIVGKDRTR